MASKHILINKAKMAIAAIVILGFAALFAMGYLVSKSTKQATTTDPASGTPTAAQTQYALPSFVPLVRVGM